MAQVSQLNHHVFSNTALPYVSNSSALSTDPQYISGSKNVLTNIRGVAEKRPGFSDAVESVATSFSALKRIYVFQKWGSFFYAMFCDVSGGVAKVYKYCYTVDTSAHLIWTSASAEPFDFVFSNNTCYFGNGTDMKKFLATSSSDTTVYNWGIAAQPAAPGTSLTGTGISAAVGYQYLTTGYNSTTGHESSPSPVSVCTGTFSNESVVVTWVDPADTQADFVKVYKTLDGGSSDPTQMLLIAKVARGVQTYTDATWDNSALATVTEAAPQTNYNDPPPAGYGMVWSQGRIWYHINATTWYTGYEEISKGVPEECVPGGTLGIFGGGNAYNWPSQVNGHAAMEDGVDVILSMEHWKIEGDSLDTFRRYRLLARRGVTSRTNVASLGSSVLWLDTSGQMWFSDLGEIGLPIRPDTEAIDQTKSYVAIHISGNMHWAVLMDGGNGKLYIFDLDNNQWLPPWTVGTTCSALASYQTATNTVDLMLGRNGTKALKLNAAAYNDDGISYSDEIRFGMLWIANASQFLERFDRSNPEWRGVVDNVEIKTESRYPDAVSQLNDDNPAYGIYTAITRTDDANLDVPQGSYIFISRYPSQPTTKVGRMTSIDLQWSASTSFWRLYQLDIAYMIYGE